jgi:glycolate oxidase iron-sulfur subunit
MHVELHQRYRDRPAAREAQELIRACVHCGFCTATCPTYIELGDERDGPRGRIHLLMQLLEGGPVSERTQTHLDRCLSCRSCETTCPSGVRYGRLADVGRRLIEEQVPRRRRDRLVRWLLRKVVPNRRLFGVLTALGHAFRPLLPAALKAKLPARRRGGALPVPRHDRRMLLLEACAQSAATPATNAAAARVLDRLGIRLETVPGAGCCGAISHHLSAHGEALDHMRRNIDAWWPAIEQGAEAVVSTASGCGLMLTDYGKLLSADPDYAEKAARVSGLARDLAVVVAAEDLSSLGRPSAERVAVHVPCTLYHGLRQPTLVQQVLRRAGYELSETREPHLCCGSAGTYSILQPELSRRLAQRKVAALCGDAPDLIATANVGCQLQLAGVSNRPVRHWIELLDR